MKTYGEYSGFRNFVNKISDGITISDDSGRFEVFNSRMREITGYTLKQANLTEDFGARIINNHAERTKIFSIPDKLANSRKNSVTDTVIRTKDGTDKPLRVSSCVIQYKDSDMCLKIWQDFSDNRSLQKSLQDSELRFRRLFETAQDGILLLEAGTAQIQEVNTYLIDMLGYSRKEFLGKKLWEIGAFIDRDKCRDTFKELQDKKFVRYEDLPLKTKDGKLIQVEFISNEYKVGDKDVIQCNIRNITDRKKAEEARRQSEMDLLQSQKIARLSRWELDLKSGVVVLSEEAAALFEFDKSTRTISYKLFFEAVHPEDRAFIHHDHLESIKNKQPYEFEHRLLMQDGGVKWVNRIGRVEYDNRGLPVRVIGTFQDVTERKNLEIKMIMMAQNDELTQLPNRKYFIEKVNQEIVRAKRTGMKCAVMFVDLDHFKNVNDWLGHAAGDKLLKDTVLKISLCVREIDIMARLGGDEFIIFLNDLPDEHDAQIIAARILEKNNAARNISGNDLFITASIGIAVYPNDGNSLEDLMKYADMAMYAAKQSGRNAFRFYDPAMNENAIKRMNIEVALRDALANKEFVLVYQPIINMQNGKVRGFEALVRWPRADGKVMFPDEFIPIAEDSGLIVSIGKWVLHESCRFNKGLYDSGFSDVVVSVNVSVAQLRCKEIVGVIKSALDQSGLRPELLEIEVTESLFIESFDVAIEILNAIKSLGVRIALDDFGTGYSSLVHLQKLPIDNLKLDRLFIKEIARKSDESIIVAEMIKMAHGLEVQVIAEGVESEIQLNKLYECGCDFYQGYFCSKPMPADSAMPFLKQHPEGAGKLSGR